MLMIAFMVVIIIIIIIMVIAIIVEVTVKHFTLKIGKLQVNAHLVGKKQINYHLVVMYCRWGSSIKVDFYLLYVTKDSGH